MDFQNNASGSRVMPTWNSIAAFSKECVAKLVHGVLLLYLVVSSVLHDASVEVKKLHKIKLLAICYSTPSAFVVYKPYTLTRPAHPYQQLQFCIAQVTNIALYSNSKTIRFLP